MQMSADDHQDDDANYRGLLGNHSSWLRSVIVARLGTAEGVDDVLQEVNVAAIEQKAPLREPAALRAWLFQVAVRQSLLFRRKAGRYRKLIGRAESRHVMEDAEDLNPLGWLLSTERRGLIREALQELQGRDRELLVLKYVERWTYREIARHCGSTERAIESRVHRARASLRTLLARRNVVETDRVETDQ